MADANYGSVVLLIPGIGANNSTTFNDYSKYYRGITANVDTKISTAQSKFYGSSIAFPGSILRNLVVDNNDELLLLEAATSWTVRFWVRLNTLTSVNGICSTRDNLNGMVINVNTSGQVQVFNVGGEFYTSTATLSATTWHHVEIVRNSGTLYVFVDGAADGTLAWSSNSSETPPQFVVGASKIDGFQPLDGYLNDFEVTVGVARHTSAFTVPTQLCPGITGTAQIGNSEAYQVRSQSIVHPSGTYSPTATPGGSGSYTLYTADVKQTVICHHDDPTGTVTATPEAAVIDPGGVQNFYGINEGANNVGGINSILLSTL